MSRSLSRDRWSDQGDPALARRLARMWVIFAILSWGIAGLTSVAWWVAQVGDYQNNFRGFNADDAFPWIFVILCVVAGVSCLPIARTQRARARHLAEGS
ncbi:hypothetical protein ACQEVI_21170 [Promicromonospora sp. CA-289599]|uniref:hypothetical protein n=1 Tax=Promicromonospora sp. CA-289599 TaxID=3240014 RepID=UPI003D8A1FC6